MYKYPVNIDFCKDFDRIILKQLERYDVSCSSSGYHLWCDFFNLIDKIIPPFSRKVHFSKEFICPPKWKIGLDNLIKKIEKGEPLLPHQSKLAIDPQAKEALLYHWGVYHLHLGILPDVKNPKYVQRTEPLLFLCIDKKNAYLIGLYSHGEWGKLDILQRIKNNWAFLIKPYLLPEATAIIGKNEDGEDVKIIPSDKDIIEMRRLGVTSPVQLPDGSIYCFAGNRGFMSSGHSCSIITRCDHIHNSFIRFENYIKTNTVFLIEDIYDKLNIKLAKLIFVLWIEDGIIYAYELQSHYCLYLCKSSDLGFVFDIPLYNK